MSRLPDDFDPFAPETIENPYAFYAALRREAPVYALERTGYSVVSRYEDCRAVSLAPERYSSNLVAMVFEGVGGGADLVTIPDDAPRPVDVLAIADDPAHARQRKVCNRAFAPRRIAGLEPSLRELTRRLLADARADGDRYDWMPAVAAELPTRVICRLVGLPEEDRSELRDWANAGSSLLSGTLTADEAAAAAGQVLELSAYLGDRFDAAAAAPADDALGDLVRATEDNDEHLSRDEVVAILLQLLSAGTESTTALIGSAVRLLAERPELQSRLRANPELVPAFVEETVRVESPFQGHFRVAVEDGEIAAIPVPAGTRLMLLWGSANRDERVFENADRVDLERANLREHLGFGIGAHHCIGAALARLEARVAIEELLAATSSVSVDDRDACRHVSSVMIRRLERLPLAIAES